MSKKQQFNIRLETRLIAVIDRIAAELGCSQAGVVIQGVRLLAKREGVPIAAPKTDGKNLEKNAE